MRRTTFTAFALQCADRFEQHGHFSTAHLYKNALRSYARFLNRTIVAFSDFNRNRLKAYEQWLLDRGKRPNTVSTYLRMLRSIYNKGIDNGYAPYIRHLFHDVYTGIDTNHKQTLDRKELHTLLYENPGSERLRKTQFTARLIFQLCGIPFVDLTHIREANVIDGAIEYHRMKTGTKVKVQLLPPAKKTLLWLRSHSLTNSDTGNDRLLRLFGCEHNFHTVQGYREYQRALRRFNLNLKALGRKLHIKGEISSYSLRHAWATTAKYTGAPIEMISELLGHKSIKTTQIYLAAFDASQLAKVNQCACQSIEKVG